MKNKYKKVLLIICFIMLLYCIGGIVYSSIDKKKDNKNVDSGICIKGYEYILYKTHPKLYKTEFKVLKKNLESENIDYQEYAKSISKMFLIDLYTLDNKKNMYDVGGTIFVYPESRENYKLNVTNTLYKYMKDNTVNKRNQQLPVVKNVLIESVNDNKFTIGENEFEGYKLQATIEYEKDMGYDTEIEVIIVKQGKYLYIVESNNSSNEKKDIQSNT